MGEELLHDATIALKSEWNLLAPEMLSEEELLHLLAERVRQLIDEGPESFYQLMYRLDISERKLHAAAGSSDVADTIARLIYDRQIEKIKSRNKYRQSKDNIDPDLKW